MSMGPLKSSDLPYISAIYFAKPAGFVPLSLLKQKDLTLEETAELLSGSAKAINGICFFNAHDVQAIQLLKESHTITYEEDILKTLNQLKEYRFHPQLSLFKILRVKVYALWQQYETKLNAKSATAYGHPDGPETIDSIADQINAGFAYIFQAYITYQHEGDPTVEKDRISSIGTRANNVWKILDSVSEQKYKNIAKLKQLAKFLFQAFRVDTRLLAEFSLPGDYEKVPLVILSNERSSRLEAMAEFTEELLASYSQNIRWFKHIAQKEASRIKHPALRQAIAFIDTLSEKITKLTPKLTNLMKSLTKPINGLSPNIDELLAQKMNELDKFDELIKNLNPFYANSLHDFQALEKKFKNDKKCTFSIEFLKATWNHGLQQDHTMLLQYLFNSVSMFRKEIQEIQDSIKQAVIFSNPLLASAHFTSRIDAALLEMNQHFLYLDRCVKNHEQIDGEEKKNIRKNLVDASDYLVMMIEAARNDINVYYYISQMRTPWEFVKLKIEKCKTHLNQSLDKRLVADSDYKKAIFAIMSFVNAFKKLIESENEKATILVLHHAFRIPSPMQLVFHEADQLFFNKQHEMLIWRLEHLDLDAISQRLLDWKNGFNLSVNITGIYNIMRNYVDAVKQFKPQLLSHLLQSKETDRKKMRYVNIALEIRRFGNIEAFDVPWLTEKEAEQIASSIEDTGLSDCFHDIRYVFANLNLFSNRPLLSWASNQWLIQSDPKRSTIKKTQNIQYAQDVQQPTEKIEEEEDLFSSELDSLPLLNSQVLSLPDQAPQIVLLETLKKTAVSKFSISLTDHKLQPFLEEIHHNLRSYLSILRELFYQKTEESVVLVSEHQKLSKAFLCLEQILKGCILIDKNTNLSQEIESVLRTHEMNLLVKRVIQCMPSLKEQMQPLHAIIDRWQNYVPILSRYPDEWKFSSRGCHQDALDLLQACLKILEKLPVASQSKSLNYFETPVVMSLVNETENLFQVNLEECKKLFTHLNFKMANSSQDLFAKAAEYMRNIQVAINQLDKLRQLPAVEISFAWAEQSLLHASVLVEQCSLLRLLISPIFVEDNQNILTTSVSIQGKERLWKHSHRIHLFIQCMQLQDVDMKKMEEFAEFLQVTTHYPHANTHKPLTKKLNNLRLWSELKQGLIDQDNFIDSRLANWSMATLGTNVKDWRTAIDSNVQQEISQLEKEYLQPALHTVKLILKLIAKV